MIAFNAVGFTWPGSSDPVLHGIDLRVDAAEIVAVVGGNGSGKSTLARLAAGLLEPTEGRVRRPDGRVALVLQDPDAQVVASSVEEDVAFGLECRAIARGEMVDRVARALERFGLANMRTREPHSLSGGEQQRVALAGGWVLDTTALVLDEPTSMLDPAHAARVRHEICRFAADGAAVLWVTHHPDSLACARRVVALEGGTVAFDGDPRKLLADAGLLDRSGWHEPPAARIARALAARGVPGSSLPVNEGELRAMLGVEPLVESGSR